MKSALAIIFLTAFIGISIFGFIGMTGKEMAHGGCLAELAAKGMGICLPGINSFEIANFHLNVFKSFSSATINFESLFILFFAAILFLFLKVISEARFSFNENWAFKNKFLKRTLNFYKNREMSWLALHENSPALLMERF